METDTVIQKFRTALNGFNRQDVQQYIEQIADVHRQELNFLQKQLEETQARNAQLEEAMSNVEIAKSDAAQEEARALASLESSTRALSQTRGAVPNGIQAGSGPAGTGAAPGARWPPWSQWRRTTPS